MALQVDVVGVDRNLWSGEASALFARTADGEIGILPGHTPLLAILAEGEIRVKPVGSSAAAQAIASVSGGFISVEHDKVTVVSDSATPTPESSSS